jgi:hypothetical protein
MNATMTGAALTLHNLGLAAGFGGSLYGQMAMHPALKTIESRKERGELLNKAWRNYSPANAFGLAAVALTWVTGRQALSGREIDAQTRGLVLAKDALVALYVGSGIASIVVGMTAGRNEPPVETGGIASFGASEAEAKGIKAVNMLGKVSIVAAAGIIALTSVLNIKAGRSSRWAALSSLLP